MTKNKTRKVRFNLYIGDKIHRTRKGSQIRKATYKKRKAARKSRRRRIEYNRYLRNLENEMRKNDLLFKDEYLKARKKSINRPYKHLRGELINFICHDRGWLDNKFIVKIVD